MMYASPTMILKIKNTSCQLLRQFHFNPVVCLNHIWREEQKLPTNPNSFGPLTNLPDYSFKNNKVVPYGSNQKKRIDKQREILMKIKKLVGEIDYAVERHRQLKAEEEKQKNKPSELKQKKIKFFKEKALKKEL